ncbi:hypothetical protein [Chlorogloeopsis sp. ULAP01]|nr:hypothetical protein [Chlorogloeopsis sp. ULAP01]
MDTSKFGRCFDSIQPPGDRIKATLAASVYLDTLLIYSSMIFGLFPAA